MFDNDMMEMLQLLQRENGIATILQQPVYSKDGETEPSVSQAEIIADLINLMRLDIKRIAAAEDVEVEITRIRPEQAAILVQGLIKGDSLELVDVFNGIEEQRETVLEAILDEDEYEKHIATKENVLFSNSDRETEPVDAEAQAAIEKQTERLAGETGIEMKNLPDAEETDDE